MSLSDIYRKKRNIKWKLKQINKILDSCQVEYTVRSDFFAALFKACTWLKQGESLMAASCWPLTSCSVQNQYPSAPPIPPYWLRGDQWGWSKAMGTFCRLTLTIGGDGCRSVDGAMLGLRYALAHIDSLSSFLGHCSERRIHCIRGTKTNQSLSQVGGRGLTCCESLLKLMKQPWNSFNTWETHKHRKYSRASHL